MNIDLFKRLIVRLIQRGPASPPSICLWMTFIPFVCVAPAFGQKVGEKIEVISSTLKLKVDAKEGIAVPKGTVLTVKSINGDWLWVEHSGENGWIQKKEVTLWKSTFEKRIANGTVNLGAKNFDAATRAFNDAIQLEPASFEAYMGLGKAHLGAGKNKKAILAFSEALKLNPENSDAYEARGNAYKNQLQYAEALEDHMKAISLGKNTPLFLDEVAWTLATCPYKEYCDANQALMIAKEACEISKNKEPWYFDTVAAAYAENGDFEQAIEWASKILATPNNLSAPQLAGVKSRIALYKRGIPFHEPWTARNDIEKLVGPPPSIASVPPIVPTRIQP